MQNNNNNDNNNNNNSTEMQKAADMKNIFAISVLFLQGGAMHRNCLDCVLPRRFLLALYPLHSIGRKCPTTTQDLIKDIDITPANVGGERKYAS